MQTTIIQDRELQNQGMVYMFVAKNQRTNSNSEKNIFNQTKAINVT